MSKQISALKFSFLASGNIFNRSLSFSLYFYSFSAARFLLVTFFLGVELGTTTVVAASLSSFKMSCIGVSWFASISSTKFFPDDNLILWIFDNLFWILILCYFVFLLSFLLANLSWKIAKMNKGDLWSIKV